MRRHTCIELHELDGQSDSIDSTRQSPTRNPRIPRVSAIALLAAALLAAPAHSVTITWGGALASENWDANLGPVNNWDFIVPGAGDDVVFSDTAADFIVDLNGDRTVISATFSGTSGYTLNNNTLTLSSGNLTATGSAGHTINSNVVLGAAGDWDIGGTSLVVVNGIVSGGFQLTKTGTAVLALTGNNTYTGSTRIEAGTLVVTGGEAIPEPPRCASSRARLFRSLAGPNGSRVC